MKNNTGVTYKLNDDSVLLINDEVINALSPHIQRTPFCHEKGGIIIGQYRKKHILLTGITPPQTLDKSSMFQFIRQSVNHLSLAINAWRDSGKLNTYIGEWHTHPEDHPTPSHIDIGSWRNNLPRNKKIILIIQGRKTIWVGMYFNTQLVKLIEL